MVGRTGIEPVTISLSLCVLMFNKAEIMIPLSPTPLMVERGGVEPSNPEGTDLQSVVITN